MKQRYALLIIDPQNDFHSGGSLKVPGADADTIRISEMIESNVNKISDIYITLDTHHKEHIANTHFWNNKKDGTGIHPLPFTTISYEDIINHVWFPTDSTLLDYCKYYTKELERKGRFKLFIWPDHCIINTYGHDLPIRLQKALQKWNEYHNNKLIKYIKKGLNNLTEMYSAIEAEVPVVNDPLTQTNYELLFELTKQSKVLICGQALSHCVNYTTRDILKYWIKSRDSKDLILLLDACSPVSGYENDAIEFVQDMKNANVSMNLTSNVFNELNNNSIL